MALMMDNTSSVSILFLHLFFEGRKGREFKRSDLVQALSFADRTLCPLSSHTHSPHFHEADGHTHTQSPQCFYHSHCRRYTHTCMWGYWKPDISPVEPQIRPRRQAASGFIHTDTHIQQHKHTHSQISLHTIETQFIYVTCLASDVYFGTAL